jgi:AraC family transcriptional regulator
MGMLEHRIERTCRLPHFSLQLASHRLSGNGDFELCEPIHTIAFQRRASDLAPSGRFRVPEARPTFSAIGRVMVVPAATPLEIRNASADSSTIRCCFRPADLEALTGDRVLVDPARLHGCLNIGSRLARRLLVEIGNEMESPGFAQQTMLESLGGALIVEVVRHLRRMPRQTAPLRVGLREPVFRRLEERIREPGSPPALAELAQLAECSVRHLTRGFRERTGLGIHQYIERQRCALARQWLRDTDLPVAVIASQLGFRSPAYFSTAFRRLVGQSPRDYRRR